MRWNKTNIFQAISLGAIFTELLWRQRQLLR